MRTTIIVLEKGEHVSSDRFGDSFVLSPAGPAGRTSGKRLDLLAVYFRKY
ncbi:hypothetical protein [Janthinobacterium sp. CG3]|nr:hypothetical protein [Janthinobacterium sp. CG3]